VTMLTISGFGPQLSEVLRAYTVHLRERRKTGA